MQVGRFDLTATDYSKMGSSTTNERITYYDSDSERSITNQGKYNEGLSTTPISSDTDLNNIVVEAKEDAEQTAKMNVYTDGEWVHVPSLGVHHNKQELTSALEAFHNSTVESKRARFHQEMSEIEHKVNDILYTVHTLDPKVCFQRMQPSCFYEIKGSNEIDIFLVFDHVFDRKEFIIEEAMDSEFKDCVRIRRTKLPGEEAAGQHENEHKLVTTRDSLGAFCVKSPSSSDYLSAKLVGSRFKDLVLKTFQYLPKEWRESQPECKLNSKVYKQDGTALGRTKSFQKYLIEKRVSFQDDQRYIVNLIPTIACANYWSPNFKRPEPTDHVNLNTIVEQGVHLVAMPTDKDTEDVWKVKFLNAQRALRSKSKPQQNEQICLRVIKVLCENELGYSRYFLPFYLENIALQLYEQNPEVSDWTDNLFPVRFLEFLANVYQALKARKCMYFFIPQINILSDIPERYASRLARKVLGILKEPMKYLDIQANGDISLS